MCVCVCVCVCVSVLTGLPQGGVSMCVLKEFVDKIALAWQI